MPPQAKRQRAGTIGIDDVESATVSSSSARSAKKYSPSLPVPEGVTLPSDTAMLASLNPTQLQELALALVQRDASNFARSKLTDYWITIVNKDRAKVIDFDAYSKNVWRSLNPRGRMSGSAQYEAAFDVASDIHYSINAIGDLAKPTSSYGTKLNAIETLRKIGKSIVLAGDTLGSEVIKQSQSDTILQDTILAILESMSPDERVKAGQNVSEPGKPNLADKMDWISDEYGGHCLDEEETFFRILSLLRTGEEDAGSMDDEEDESEVGDENPSLIMLN
jgi:hypothetical protein